MMKYVAGAIAILLLVVVVVFSIQNLGIVDVKFLSLSVSVPKFVVVLGSYVMGMITGGSVVSILKMARQTRKHGDSKGGKD